MDRRKGVPVSAVQWVCHRASQAGGRPSTFCQMWGHWLRFADLQEEEGGGLGQLGRSWGPGESRSGALGGSSAQGLYLGRTLRPACVRSWMQDCVCGAGRVAEADKPWVGTGAPTDCCAWSRGSPGCAESELTTSRPLRFGLGSASAGQSSTWAGGRRAQRQGSLSWFLGVCFRGAHKYLKGAKDVRLGPTGCGPVGCEFSLDPSSALCSAPVSLVALTSA